MMLVVGNSGPTVATDIKVTIEPPLPSIEQLQGARAAQERLAEGFKSLPPGRTLGWWLGQGWNVIAKEGPQVHRITNQRQRSVWSRPRTELRHRPGRVPRAGNDAPGQLERRDYCS
jgi:hypothetical protein